MSADQPLHLFSAFGIELEYMIVDAGTLSVKPIADELLKLVGGGYEMEVERGPIAWSNELALHVIELKTNGPAGSLAGLGDTFQRSLADIEALIEPFGARLLPTAMHPWMDPLGELRLWPHQDNAIYNTFDRIFDCRGHGWANLQSMHINFPFAGDEEFGRLHAAIRMVLPLLPGLAASSPYWEGKASGFMDTRLHVYRDNARRVPSVSGQIIPERVFTQHAYEQELLAGIYRDLAPLDPDGVLQHEWVNARGCIARFDRMAIEIRLLDLQECPQADLSVAGVVIEVVRAMTEGALCEPAQQRGWDEAVLSGLLSDATTSAGKTVIDNRAYLDAFGFPGRTRATLGELWQHLIERCVVSAPEYPQWEPALSLIQREGCLARRIERAVGPDSSREALRRVYGELADCLRQGRLFRGIG
ncbi:MAG: glutamate-cysteine ligase family protein [Myxococcales bacterium]|nr:glutamate-cysteine ligase family protein [Myxococcales bacterium]